MALTNSSNPNHVIGICGGAVSGSEAAAQIAKAGAIAIVFEQNLRPYGKIEDGLPRWHSKLRKKEYARIDENLSTPGVIFVPATRLGHDLSFKNLSQELGLSGVILAHGAWRDRPLAIAGAESFVDRGLVYQNPFVYWFNHYEEAGYAGTHYPIHDDAVVVGGGLASIDVCKILNLELYARAMRERGLEVDLEEMEVRGIPKTLEKLGLSPEDFDIKGCTLFYRRGKEDMPLASMNNPTPEQLAKLRISRAKIMDKVMRKFLVRLETHTTPVGLEEEDGQLSGVVFQRTEIIEGRVKMVEGSEFSVATQQMISSIGSIPMPIDGVPMKGELYQWESWDEGKLLDGVYGLGNVLTGTGNIKASRQNSLEITPRVIEKALQGPQIPSEGVEAIMRLVKERWNTLEYPGNYAEWIERHRP